MTALSVPTARREPSEENFTAQTTLGEAVVNSKGNKVADRVHTQYGYKPSGVVRPSDGVHQD